MKQQPCAPKNDSQAATAWGNPQRSSVPMQHACGWFSAADFPQSGLHQELQTHAESRSGGKRPGLHMYDRTSVVIPLILCAIYIRVSRVGNSCWVILETNSTCPQPVLSVSRHSGSHNNSHAEHVRGLDDPLKARQSPSAHLIHGSLLGGALVFATHCLKQLGRRGRARSELGRRLLLNRMPSRQLPAGGYITWEACRQRTARWWVYQHRGGRQLARS